MVNLADLTRLHLKSEHLHGSADAEFDPLLTRQGMADAQLAVRAYTPGFRRAGHGHRSREVPARAGH